MKGIRKLQCNSYYIFESKSSGRSCYFESDREIDMFKSLFTRYMSKYVEVHRMYFSSEGYHILLRVRDSSTIRSNYIKSCKRRGTRERKKFIEEYWRIVSEGMRIFHSVYVKAVNKIRGREGVLVQRRYGRYYFESVEEGMAYILEMDKGKEVEGQREGRYGVSKRWKMLVDWGKVRGKQWVESTMNIRFRSYVVEDLILLTIASHSPP